MQASLGFCVSASAICKNMIRGNFVAVIDFIHLVRILNVSQLLSVDDYIPCSDQAGLGPNVGMALHKPPSHCFLIPRNATRREVIIKDSCQAKFFFEDRCRLALCFKRVPLIVKN
jgi:hypothetical protein